MTKESRTAIVGIGRWGGNIARELAKISDLRAYVSSGSSENIAWAKEHIPSAERVTLEDICSDTSINAAVVATPIKTHERITHILLTAGKHVLVEKPTAESSTAAARLAHQAAERNLVLATGYVFLYHPVYEELRKRVSRSSIRSISCTWKKYGTFGENIAYNLLTHHLALAYDLLGMPLSGTLKRGRAVKSDCDQIDVTLEYKSATFTSSIDRLSEERKHVIEITTNDNRLFVWDGDTFTITENNKPPHAIYAVSEQPLAREIQTFLTAVETENLARLRTHGLFGACVLEIHEKLRAQK